MALSNEDKKEIKALLNREPSQVEEMIFDTMWSEHCSYKSTKRILKHLPTKGSEVALGIGEDAGIIQFAEFNNKRYCIAVSHESHNHPSQILPIEGAATGVGGCVRDVYCMGADVFGVLDSLHFGKSSDPAHFHVDEIAQKVVHGVADYGNPLGVPVLGGETLYHESYNDNCLVNVSALGLVCEDDIIHSYTPKEAKEEPYDVILFGKSTDATGFGGASFSSATLDTEDNATNIGAVQVHDPFLKRVLVEAIKALLKRVKEKNIPIGFKDLGAGGISCATSEIAVGGGFGIDIDLDKVNIAIPNLNPEVIACSETQERFCLVVPKTFSNEVLDIFNHQFKLPTIYPKAGAAVIGKIITQKQFIIRHQGKLVCDLPVEAITTEVSVHRHSKPKEIPHELATNCSLKKALKDTCLTLLGEKNNDAKQRIYTHYDNAVRGDTVVYPGEADAVVVTPVDGCKAAVAVSMDSNLYGDIDPYTSGAYAVAESIRNVVAVGAYPIALTDCLNYGNPEKPNVFYDFEQGVQGIADAANQLNFRLNEAVPIISGNVSLYNESKTGRAVIPSPVVMCVGKMEDYTKAITMQLTKSDHILIAVGSQKAAFSGTQIAPFLTGDVGCSPQVDFESENKQNHSIYQLINERKLHACHDISMGGVWVALVEMLLGQKATPQVGAQVHIDEDEVTTLFSETGGYLIAVSMNVLHDVKTAFDHSGIQYKTIGKTVSTPALSLKTNKETLHFSKEELQEEWSKRKR